MPITASKYINNSKEDTSYIGLYHYSAPIRGKDTSLVDIYGLLRISSDIKIPGDKIAKFAWDGIVDGFEYSKTDSTNESLKLSLVEATGRIKQLIANDKEIGEHGVNIDFTILVSNGSGIYLGLLGESDIFIYKEGRVVDISEMLLKKKAKTAGVLIEDGDVLFLSTKTFLKENLPRLIRSKSSEQIITALEELGRDVGKDQGLVVFLNQKEELKKGLPILSPQEAKKEKIEKEPNLETSTSDYISTSKATKKILKSPSEGKDLKHYISFIYSKLTLFYKTIGVKLIPVKTFFKNTLTKTKTFFKNQTFKTKENLANKFRKERWFKKVSAKVSQNSLQKRKKKEFKGMKIDGYKEKNTRFRRVKVLLLAVLGIALVLSGIKFTMNQRDARERSKKANEIFNQVDELVTQAQDTLTRDRANTELLVFKATEQLSQVPPELNEKDLEKQKELEGLVMGISDTLFRKVRLSESDSSITSYFETLVSFGRDSKPSDIGIYRDSNSTEYLLVTDSGTNNVYRISLYDKKHSALPDDNSVISKPEMVYTKDSGIYVMDFTNGIVKAEFDDNWFKPFTTLSGLSLQNIAAEDIIEFAVLTTNENVYVLDRGQRSLLRATRYGSGYGLASKYLTKDEYQNANDVLADLSVYILTPGEYGIHRYVYSLAENRMVEAPIKLVGLDKPLSNARYGFTRDDLNKSLYIFDSDDKRILRFEKPMESGELRHPNELHLLKQYVFEEEEGAWNSVKDFVVDFREENLYLLDGTKIWKVKL